MNCKSFSLPVEWLGKPYYSLNAYLKKTFGEKIYKVSLDAGLTCPNRDGTIDSRGCIFCSAGGSGDFALPISTNKSDFIKVFQEQINKKQIGKKYIAYFQAYTNTYGSVAYLEQIYRLALTPNEVIGISIGTRPDCISEEILDLFQKLRIEFPEKFIWIELGLQTIHEKTATYIRRGYPLSCFEQCCQLLMEHQIPIVVHTILGLPGETKKEMYETIEYIANLHPFGIKLQLLHVLQGTDLETDYHNQLFSTLSMNDYLEIVIHSLELLPKDIVIHRVTGDGPKNLTIAPLWSFQKKNVLNTLHHLMQETQTYQGRCYHDPRSSHNI